MIPPLLWRGDARACLIPAGEISLATDLRGRWVPTGDQPGQAEGKSLEQREMLTAAGSAKTMRIMHPATGPSQGVAKSYKSYAMRQLPETHRRPHSPNRSFVRGSKEPEELIAGVITGRFAMG